MSDLAKFRKVEGKLVSSHKDDESFSSSAPIARPVYAPELGTGRMVEPGKVEKLNEEGKKAKRTKVSTFLESFWTFSF